MKWSVITLSASLALAGCATKSVEEAPLKVGDRERAMVAKMVNQGARDVTKQTGSGFFTRSHWNSATTGGSFPTIQSWRFWSPPRGERKRRFLLSRPVSQVLESREQRTGGL